MRNVIAIIIGMFALAAAHAATDRIFRNGFEPPIQAPAQTWTFTPFSQALCANGTSTGIGVNLTSPSAPVLIYLEGGGACWNELGCYTTQTAANINSGYGSANFASESTSTSYLAAPGGFFDRTAAANPFKDDNYVYVPYCTGDYHGGNAVVTLGAHITHFVGFQNMGVYLAALADTFPAATHVVIAGSDAGGYGAVINARQTQEAFPQARVDIIDDSGVFMPRDVQPMSPNNESAQIAAWNLAAALPADCSACAGGLDKLYSFYAAEFPNRRGALLTYHADSIAPLYYGISSVSFSNGLTEVEGQFDTTTNFRYFDVSGSSHYLWFNPTQTVGTVSVLQYLTTMMDDSATWTSVHP